MKHGYGIKQRRTHELFATSITRKISIYEYNFGIHVLENSTYLSDRTVYCFLLTFSISSVIVIVEYENQQFSLLCLTVLIK